MDFAPLKNAGQPPKRVVRRSHAFAKVKGTDY